MTPAELQAFLARLYTSAAFRDLFRLDPERALDGYFLTDGEREMARSLDLDAIDWFSSSLRVKRRGRLERAYPALFAIDEPALDIFYRRYHEIYPLRPGASGETDALQFGAFMEETLGGGASLPAYAADLVRFERTLQELRRDVRADARSRTGKPPDGNGPLTRPSRRAGVAVATFHHNVSEIDDALRERREPEVRQEEEIVVYAMHDGDREPAILRVSEATALVLSLCDGVRTVAEIVAEMEARYEQSGLQEGVIGAVERLSTLAILEEGDAQPAA